MDDSKNKLVWFLPFCVEKGHHDICQIEVDFKKGSIITSGLLKK